MNDEIESDFIAFAPDSPLFGIKANDSHHNTLLLSEFLVSIVSKMKDLCDSLKHTAATGSALASQMQGVGIGGSTKYSGCVSPIIKHFGGILGGISSSQEILAECLENAFIRPLEHFNVTEVLKITVLQQQFKKDRQQNDENISRYLQSDISGTFTMTRSMNQALLSMKALEVVQHRKKFEVARFDFVRAVNAVQAQKNFEIAEACINVLFALRSHHRESSERLNSSSSMINDMSEQQFKARNKFNLSALPIDSMRSNMMSVLDTMIERVETQLPQHASITSINPSESFQYIDQTNQPSDYSSLGLVGSDLNVSAAASQAISRLGSMGASFIGSFQGSKPFHILGSASEDQDRRQPVPDKSTLASAAVFSDVEMRMKALDRHQLEPFYAPHSMEEYSGLIKQGYLLERSSAKLLVQHTWNREWFVLDDTKLYVIKEKERDWVSSLDAQVVCETMLASVRELKNFEVPFVFEISYANKSSHTLQAEGHREYDSWVGAIRHAIEKRLVGDSSSSFPALLGNNSSSASDSSSSIAATRAIQNRLLNADIVKRILEGSPECAECSRPDPEWVSLNLGCLVCIECSGVHRSLGVHVSKMRSLTLDDLDPEEYNMLSRVGNHLANSVWEPCVSPAGPKKPRPHDSYAVRERFIRAKYEQKLFLRPSYSSSVTVPTATTNAIKADSGAVIEGESGTSITADEALRCACRTDDALSALRAIAHGADICTAVHSTFMSPASKGLTPQAPSSSSKIPSASVSALPTPPPPKTPPNKRTPSVPSAPLGVSFGPSTVSGAVLEEPDNAECSPLHLAVRSGSCACVVLLLLSGADPYHSSVTQTLPLSLHSANRATGVPSGAPTLVAVAEAAGHKGIADYLHRKLDVIAPIKSTPSTAPTPIPAAPADSPIIESEDVPIESPLAEGCDGDSGLFSIILPPTLKGEGTVSPDRVPSGDGITGPGSCMDTDPSKDCDSLPTTASTPDMIATEDLLELDTRSLDDNTVFEDLVGQENRGKDGNEELAVAAETAPVRFVKGPTESEPEDELDDFFEALMKDFPAAKS